MVWAINGVVVALTYNWFLGPPTVTRGEAKSVLFFRDFSVVEISFYPRLTNATNPAGIFLPKDGVVNLGSKKVQKL